MKFQIPNMTCGHCVATIENAVKAVDSAAVVQPDLAAHTAEIKAKLSSAALVQILAEAGYSSSVLEDDKAT